jgi:nitrate reductase delta subunit
MIKTYKILSLFLSYPGQDLQMFLREGAGELRKEGLLDRRIIDNLEGFASYFSGMDLIDWQAHYVSLFDISRNTSLYIFEHLRGDSKERGQAMADLLDFYLEEGFEMKEGELPDYLPAFLEFLSSLDRQKASELLSQPVNILNRIYSILKEKNNIYSRVFEAVISLSPVAPDNEDYKYSAGDLMNAGFDEQYQEPPAMPGDPIMPDK